jgi:hypothetical protein
MVRAFLHAKGLDTLRPNAVLRLPLGYASLGWLFLISSVRRYELNCGTMRMRIRGILDFSICIHHSTNPVQEAGMRWVVKSLGCTLQDALDMSADISARTPWLCGASRRSNPQDGFDLPRMNSSGGESQVRWYPKVFWTYWRIAVVAVDW